MHGRCAGFAADNPRNKGLVLALLRKDGLIKSAVPYVVGQVKDHVSVLNAA